MDALLVVTCMSVAVSAVAGQTAVVDIVPGSNPGIKGRLNLQADHSGDVTISGSLYGLTPGPHGFHVHQTGDLGDGCKAAGGHFNPLMMNHGSPNDYHRHVGDLGNILANANGEARVYIRDSHISLDPSSPAYIGDLAIVVHSGEDDLGRGGDEGSLKTGNAGARDGCGLVKVQQLRQVKLQPSRARLSFAHSYSYSSYRRPHY